MYTDSALQTYVFSDVDSTAWEFEQAADILFLYSRLADVATGSDATKDRILIPNGGQIEAFGCVLSEAISNTNTTRCVAKVQYVSVEGAAAVAAVTITIPNSTDGLAGNVTNASVFPNSRTLTQGNAIGARVVASDKVTTANVPTSTKVLPYRLAPGSNIYVEVTTAAGAAGGAGYFFVTVRHDGLNPATAASPVQRAYSTATA